MFSMGREHPQEGIGMVRSKQQPIEVTDVHPQRSMCTPEKKKKNRKNGEDSGFPTVQFKAVDLDMKVKDDHRKLADRKVGNIWTVVVYIWG